MQRLAFVTATITAAGLLSAQPALAGDGKLMDPTLDGAPRAALMTAVGYALPEASGNVEWIIPQKLEGELTGSFDDYAGDVLVLQSFDTTSSRARSAMRRLIAAMGAARELDGVRIVGVHNPLSSETSPRFLRTKMKNITVMIDHSGEWCDELGIYKTPVTVIVDRDGIIRHAGIGLQHVREAVTELANSERSSSEAPPLPARDDRVEDAPVKPVASNYPPHNTELRGARDTQGKKAPEIAVETWHNGKPDLEGKVVVVEFWATWCGPCIRNIPHFNKLAKEYRESVVFLGISDESDRKVANFVRSRKIDYTIGSDTKRRLFKFPKPRGIPHAYIQSPDGVVRWQGHPASITNALLGQIVEASGAGTDPDEKGRWIVPAE